MVKKCIGQKVGLVISKLARELHVTWRVKQPSFLFWAF